MTVLEKIAKEANDGGLSRIERAVECAENVSRLTREYSETGPEKQDGIPIPPAVNAREIIEEMKMDSREQPPVSIEQGTTPYLTEESKPLIESVEKEPDR